MRSGTRKAGLLGFQLLAALWCDSAYTDPVAGLPVEAKPVQERGSARVGLPAPHFRLWTLDGRVVSLSDYQGKVVFLNFWATWCGPCRVEMPSMEQLYREFGRQDFEILAVSTDPQGGAVTRPFKEALGLTFPILHDSDMRVMMAYGTRTLPMTFLVDRHGIITHRVFGARDWQSPEAHRFIQALVKAR